MIRVYVRSTPYCAQCAATKRYLTRASVEFDAIEVTADDIEMLKDWGFSALPVVVARNGAWSGYRQDLLAKAVAAQTT